MLKKSKNIFLLLLIITSIIFTLVLVNSFNSLMIILPDDGNKDVLPLPSPTLQPIMPNPDPDGNIYVQWSIVSGVGTVGYKLYFRPKGGSWSLIKTTTIIAYMYNAELASGVYEFAVKAYTEYSISPLSYIRSVLVDIIEPEPIYPSNPSIIIKDGAEITNSLTITLTLSCDNANEMRIKLPTGVWIGWVPYTTTYNLILSKDVISYPNYYISVIFRNIDGESEEVSDTIRYVPLIPPLPPPTPTSTPSPINTNIILFVAGVSIIGVIVVIFWLRRRK